jgi:quercetin dioxygenase-like cupin family protein
MKQLNKKASLCNSGLPNKHTVSNWFPLRSKPAANAGVLQRHALESTMIIGRVFALAAITGLFTTTELSAQIQPGCDTPANQRSSEIGCYVSAIQDIGELGETEVYWHIYSFSSSEEAQTAQSDRTAVVKAHDKYWLYAIGTPEWRPEAGVRVAVVGPLEVSPGKTYVARYMEATFNPGMTAAVHRHSGPEAWYLVSGAQCLETPNEAKLTKAGEWHIVEAGPPMALSSAGGETRRSLALVLHESSQPWSTPVSEWKPKGLCPK